MINSETAFELQLPYTPTQQVKDGCVTASARGVLSHLGVNFDTDFLPELQQRYSLNDNNPENNHMLGIAAIAGEHGYRVVVHTRKLMGTDHLPSNVPAKAHEIHPKVIADLVALSQQNMVILETGALNLESFQAKLADKLNQGFYCLAILDWVKWNKEAQAKFGNPRHTIAIVGLSNDQVLTMDPSIGTERQPFTQPVQKLFQALTEQQQLVFIGQVQDK